jgi:hypothetical protein
VLEISAGSGLNLPLYPASIMRFLKARGLSRNRLTSCIYLFPLAGVGGGVVVRRAVIGAVRILSRSISGIAISSMPTTAFANLL